MLNIHRSKSTDANNELKPQKRKPKEDNLAWLGRMWPRKKGGVNLLLLGGRSHTALRLRVAQSQARDDLSPSHWSHVLILGERHDTIGETGTAEISLEPAHGFGFPPPANGVQRGKLAAYGAAKDFPNLALVSLPGAVARKALEAAIEGFKRQRNVVDALEGVLAWLGYAWGVGKTPNPLIGGMGIPAAVFVESVLTVAGVDVTPGLASQSSCPEAIWQTAKWWHDYHDKTAKGRIEGAYCVDHTLG